MRSIDIITQANKEAVRRMLTGDPALVDVLPATEVIGGLKDKMILHAEPPVAWKNMCGPMRGAVTGIAVFEGWAENLADIEQADAGALIILTIILTP